MKGSSRIRPLSSGPAPRPQHGPSVPPLPYRPQNGGAARPQNGGAPVEIFPPTRRAPHWLSLPALLPAGLRLSREEQRADWRAALEG